MIAAKPAAARSSRQIFSSIAWEPPWACQAAQAPSPITAARPSPTKATTARRPGARPWDRTAAIIPSAKYGATAGRILLTGWITVSWWAKCQL